jgi:hypothetical protein
MYNVLLHFLNITDCSFCEMAGFVDVESSASSARGN